MPHDKDDCDRDYDDRPRRPRQPRIEIQYTFVVKDKPALIGIKGSSFRIWDTVSTSEGPHKVVEVYWRTEAKAVVLLRPIPEKELQKDPKKRCPSHSKPYSKPKRFSQRPR